MKEGRGASVVVDTNVLIHNPNAIDELREDGQKLYIPWAVLMELNNLKTRPDIGWDAREASAKIENIRLSRDPFLEIVRNPSFRSLGDLDKKIPDHQIIATAHQIQKNRSHESTTLLSRDRTVRILARELGIIAEDYIHNLAEAPKPILKEVDAAIAGDFGYDIDKHGDIGENEGLLCKCADGNKFAAIRKGALFRVIPQDIGAFGIKPFSLNGDGPNWPQYIALMQLLDPEITLVFLQGGAGSGKTLLAIASAIHQRKDFHQIAITRPMVHLEDEDRMGFLPGTIEQKMNPFMTPVWQALSFIDSQNADNGGVKHPDTARKERSKKGRKNDGEHSSKNRIIISECGIGEESEKSFTRKLIDQNKIIFESLDYIRGANYHHMIFIVDEAQNLTPHQVKTIITRAGKGTKIIFTGDLDQIDRRRRLDKNTSGLAYAMSRMKNQRQVGITVFNETVRSELAKLAEELL